MINLHRDERMYRAGSIVVASIATIRTMVVPAIVVSVVVARLAGGFERTVKVTLCQSLGIFAVDTEHNLDAVMGEDVGGARPHAPGQDNRRALLAQPHGVHPAPVLGRGAEVALADRTAVFVHGVEGERLGAAEMLAEPPLVYWNRDFHFITSFF
jgi:hypothetical protein